MRVGADQWQERREDPDAAAGQHQTARAAERREQAALDQQLAHEAPARRADRRPDRELPPPHARPDQQQVRDVRARNQEHASDRAEEDEQRTFDRVPP